ncbi:transmembrane protein, putative (macronuclear) [Tetrahymena thermophila SB210]|uniref:Transmembrane protein, putative n=1 Tax=Tetrahymena thermophila (strain SB210) TaxID=312017 RepID=W7X1E3_TETTS|nr:transmembrane protein, putative [Tetrahymena thermophila SB210]EWS71417.1 transmembrane protein, putative [Tetrahymena thermophila SB210]|eukprot:XP_012656047.1 transmembrane protein, putative [Tetrahymena thermophila SB210]
MIQQIKNYNKLEEFLNSSLLSHQVINIDLTYILLINIIFIKTKIIQLSQSNFHFNFQLLIIHFLLFDIFSLFFAIKTYTQQKQFICFRIVIFLIMKVNLKHQSTFTLFNLFSFFFFV